MTMPASTLTPGTAGTAQAVGRKPALATGPVDAASQSTGRRRYRKPALDRPAHAKLEWRARRAGRTGIMKPTIVPDQLDEFQRGLSLVRAGRCADALPLLERADSSGRFPLAGMILKLARFKAGGHDLAPVIHDCEAFVFRIGFDNIGLDMFHVDGRFFESEELDYCRSRVPPGGTIVDVGANTGNHAVYFGRFLRPSRLIPVEPNPLAVRVLKENLALNHIVAETRGYGVGVARDAGLAGIATLGGDLVVGRLIRGGSIPVTTLDNLVDGPVDLLKIDAEGMEIDILAGAEGMLRRSRPFVLVEVHDKSIEPFRESCARLGYQIDKTFRRYNYGNYFLTPCETRL